jgi:lipoprotein-anchoring transpeptidase ErfK/SrfK
MRNLTRIVVTLVLAALPSHSFSSSLTDLQKDKTLMVQIWLARQGFSPGALDGLMGVRTRNALRAYQQQENLRPIDELDPKLQDRFTAVPMFTNYTVSADDIARLCPLGQTWLAKSQQERLDYESVLELVAEKHWSHTNLVMRLNPQIEWTNVTAGTQIRVPKVDAPPIKAKAAFVRIFLDQRVIQAFDADTNVLAHFPCSVAASMDKRPSGELRVEAMAPNPNYTFNPDVFPESAEARQLGRKLILPPGPNNPVGTVWIGLDRPGYGVHGTPRPEAVGRAETHGCFRLANWNAELLLKLVEIGTPVYVEP